MRLPYTPLTSLEGDPNARERLVLSISIAHRLEPNHRGLLQSGADVRPGCYVIPDQADYGVISIRGGIARGCQRAIAGGFTIRSSLAIG